MNITLQYIINNLRGYLPESELRETALWVMEETTGMSRTEILCKDTTNIPNLEIILQQLKNGVPLQYVFGKTYWGGLTLNVNCHTLIPRPETWCLIEVIKKRFPTDSHLRLLDIGTGSGCIAIALKQCFPQWQIAACDISEDALQTAADNAALNNVKVDFFRCDILNETTDNYDIIVSNPPYVMEKEKAEMQSRVLNYEPSSALFVPDSDPLLFYRRIASLHNANYLFFEINEQMGEAIRHLLLQQGYQNISILSDFAGKDRIATCNS